MMREARAGRKTKTRAGTGAFMRTGTGARAAARGKTVFRAVWSACLLLCFPALLFGAPSVKSWIIEGGRIAFLKVLPAVFPFLVLTLLVCRTDLMRRIGYLAGRRFSRLFALPQASAAAVLLGMLSGFPLGAKCAAELYREGLCEKEDAERLLAFTNFCGAPFILSAVGQGIFGSAAVGWMIFFAQSAVSLLFGVFYRRPREKAFFSRAPAGGGAPLTAALFTATVADAGYECLKIASFILFFSIPAGALHAAFVRLSLPSFLLPLLAGSLEISSGTAALTDVGKGLPALALSCLVVGYSGLSVMMQVRSFTSDSGLSMRGYIAAHLICPPLTAAICCLAAYALGLV